MKQLKEVSRVSLQLYAELTEDERGLLLKEIEELLKKSLLVFVEAYHSFMGSITVSSDSYNRWVNLQIQFLTELGGKEPLIELSDTVKMVFEDTEGGEGYIHPEEQSVSFMVLLALRVYLDTVTGVEDPA